MTAGWDVGESLGRDSRCGFGAATWLGSHRDSGRDRAAGAVVGSGSQWSFGKGRLSGPFAVESPSPGLPVRESGRGLRSQVFPALVDRPCVSDRKQPPQAPRDPSRTYLSRAGERDGWGNPTPNARTKAVCQAPGFRALGHLPICACCPGKGLPRALWARPGGLSPRGDRRPPPCSSPALQLRWLL